MAGEPLRPALAVSLGGRGFSPCAKPPTNWALAPEVTSSILSGTLRILAIPTFGAKAPTPGAVRHRLRQYPYPAHVAFVFPCKLKRCTERAIWQLRNANHATRGVTKKIAAPISTPVMVRAHSSQENDRQIKSASNIHPHTNPGNKKRNRSTVGSVGHSNDLSRNAFLHFGHSRSPPPRKTSPGPRTIL